MSDNEEDAREGSDGETAGEGSTQPRDPETGRFLPGDAAVDTEIEAQRDADDRASDDAGEETARERVERTPGSGANRRHPGAERGRSVGTGTRGVVTLGQPPAGAEDPTRRTPDSQPVTVHLRSAEPAEQSTGPAIVPAEVLQTSAEREYPPWLAKPPESESASDREDDERESWEAPVDSGNEGPGVSQGRWGLERLQPERRATRQSPEPPEGAPRPWDGEPRQQPGTDQEAGVVQPTGLPPFMWPGRPEAVVPTLARRHQIGQWFRRGRESTRSELPPHRRPVTDRQGSSGSRDGTGRYSEPQEVHAGTGPPQQHEQWEYATTRQDHPSEKWEATWGDDGPGPAGRGRWGIERAAVDRSTERGGRPSRTEPGRTERGRREDSGDELIRPGPT